MDPPKASIVRIYGLTEALSVSPRSQKVVSIFVFKGGHQPHELSFSCTCIPERSPRLSEKKRKPL